MQARMSEAELGLFVSFAKCSDNYLEFGTGGSTCLAASNVRNSITALDSSAAWIDKVAEYCSDSKLPIAPNLIHVDIGPTGDWGYPTDPTTRHRWSSYHSNIWADANTLDVDLFLIDGRFRVACFVQAVLHAKPNAVILMHDFQSRKQYHVVREIAREVATVEDMSVFLPVGGETRHRAREILQAYEFESA